MPIFAIVLIAVSLTPVAVFLAIKRPLIFPFGLYIVMVPFDRLLGPIMLPAGIVVAATLVFHMLATRRVLAPPKSWTTWAVYTGLASLTALWTIDSTATGAAVGTLLQLFLFFTILAIFPAERKDVRLVGALIVISGTFISLCSLIGYAQGFRTQEDRLSIGLNGVLIDPNHIAASLLMPIALAIGALLESRDLRVRPTAALAAIIMVAALFLTGSRGGLIALSVMFVYLAWRTRYRFQILGLMAIGGVASLLQPTVWDRFADKGLGAGSGRLFIWNAGGLALKDHWLTGAGIGAFPAAYNHELFAMYQPVFQGWSRPAHNFILSAAVELGVFGAVLLLVGWWRSFSDARGNIVIEASLVGLTVASLFLDVMLFKYIWLALGMAALVKNAAEPRFLKGFQRQPQQPRKIWARQFWRRRSGFTVAATEADVASSRS